MRDRLKKNIKLGIITLLCFLIFGYTFYEARFLIGGPELIINSPKNNITVTDSLLEIKGQVRNLSGLTINGRPVMITTDGLFNDKLLLLDGYNTIEVKVKNKFGQKTEEILKIFLNPKT